MIESADFSKRASRYVRPAIAEASGLYPSARPDPSAPILKLNANENPYPPSPRALAALRSIDGNTLRRYPDAEADEFRRAVSDALDVPPDWVLVANGADALIDWLVRACTDRDRPIVFPDPTYPLYAHLAPLQEAPAIAVPFLPSPDFTERPQDNCFPTEDLIAARGALSFVANPNSPTGYELPLDTLRQLAAGVAGILAIDEAYIDFRDRAEPALELVREHDNTIVLRTLSKGYGLAGLRLAFAVANPALLAELWKVRPVYAIDAISARVGAAAIGDRAYQQARVRSICRTRDGFAKSLIDRGFAVWPSGGNFLLVQPPADFASARSLHDDLRSRHIWTRHYNRANLDDKLRITIGTDEQMARVLAAIDGLQ